LCSKSKNIPGRNKKIPEDFVGRKSSGREIIGLGKVIQREELQE